MSFSSLSGDDSDEIILPTSVEIVYSDPPPAGEPQQSTDDIPPFVPPPSRQRIEAAKLPPPAPPVEVEIESSSEFMVEVEVEPPPELMVEVEPRKPRRCLADVKVKVERPRRSRPSLKRFQGDDDDDVEEEYDPRDDPDYVVPPAPPTLPELDLTRSFSNCFYVSGCSSRLSIVGLEDESEDLVNYQTVKLPNSGTFAISHLGDNYIALGGTEGYSKIYIFNRFTRQKVVSQLYQKGQTTNWITSLCPLPNNRLASGDLHHHSGIWNWHTGELILGLPEDQVAKETMALTFIESENILVSGGHNPQQEPSLTEWDLSQGGAITQIYGGAGRRSTIHGVAHCVESNLLVTTSYSQTCGLISRRTAKLVAEKISSPGYSLEYCEDLHLVCVGLNNGKVLCLDTRKLRDDLCVVPAHPRGEVRAVCRVTDDLFFSAGEWTCLALWNREGEIASTMWKENHPKDACFVRECEQERRAIFPGIEMME